MKKKSKIEERIEDNIRENLVKAITNEKSVV